MILSHRRRHRRVLTVLTVCLPLTFAAGVAVRKQPPVADSLPPGLDIPVLPAKSIWVRTDLFPNTALPVRLSREIESGRFSIHFGSNNAPAAPDLLVYWLVENVGESDSVPDGAILLGAFGLTTLRLPEVAAIRPGSLLIYSLADDAVIGASRPFMADDRTSSTSTH